jgi:hypothetical protein
MFYDSFASKFERVIPKFQTALFFLHKIPTLAIKE